LTLTQGQLLYNIMRKVFLLSITLFGVIGINSTAIAGTEGHSEGLQKGSHKGSHSSDLVAPKTFIPPKPYTLRKLYKQIKKTCPSQALDCYEEELFKITDLHGPKASVKVFAKLQRKNEVKEKIDGHHIVHHIGHNVASAFGPFPEALGLCPTTYNYGCIHGFLQQVLSQKMTNPKDAVRLCDIFVNDPEATPKDKAYCYHGMGHGILMYYDYDLKKAIAMCDSVDPIGISGCWQGLFMEAVNVAPEEKGKALGYTRADPLAPCSTLEEKYQHECFINHGGWMMNVFEHDYVGAIDGCRKASIESSAKACISSISLMVSNPGWQKSFVDDPGERSMIENAVLICRNYPEDQRESCINGAISNILNFDHLDLARSEKFCQGIDQKYQSLCYKEISSNLGNIVTSKSMAQDACTTLKSEGQEICLSLWNSDN